MSRFFQKSQGRKVSKDDPTSADTGAASTNISTNEHPYGLKILSEGTESNIDIVAVHGLNGHREKTWTAKNQVNWLRDLLPESIPNARVLTWGYDANTHSTEHVSQQYIFTHGQALVSDLSRKRRVTKTLQRPIIFVAHSLGGIVVKSALIHSSTAKPADDSKAYAIKISTFGIIFMGTPHQGGNGVALGKVLVNVASIFTHANDRLLQHLEHNSEWLQQQITQYQPISSDFVTKFAYEEYPTSTALGSLLVRNSPDAQRRRDLMTPTELWIKVVPRYSAIVPGATDAEPIVIHADHINMTKFESQADSDYEVVSEHLSLMVDDAQARVKAKWKEHENVMTVTCKQIASGPIHAIPFRKNVNFVGREDDLTAIQNMFFGDDPRDRIALVGLGGIGKTQLALRFAYWVKETRSECSVFWLTTSSPERFSSECADLCKKLGIQKQTRNEDPKDMVKRHLSSSDSGQWLLILDNADDERILFSDEPGGGFCDYFPVSDAGFLLFTTRSKAVGQRLAGPEIYTLDQITEEQAIRLFRRLCSNGSGNPDADHQVRQLVEKLASHPLAVTQAAAYLIRSGRTISKYMEILNGMDNESINLLTKGVYDDTSGDPKAVATTWLVSFEQIQQKDEHAANILRFMSLMEPRAVPVSLLPDDDGSEGKQDSIDVLYEYAFITRRQDEDLLDMHPLVHLATRLWIEREGSTIDITRQTVLHVVKVLPIPEHDNTSIWRGCLPHARCLSRHAAQKQVYERWKLDFRIGLCYSEDRRDGEATAILEDVQKQTSKLEAHDQYKLDVECRLGTAYSWNGEYSKALVMLQHVVSVQERSLEENDIRRLRAQRQLAVCYSLTAQLQEAKQLLQRVLEIQERCLPMAHADRVRTNFALASVYLDLGSYEKAIALFEEILETRSTLPESHPERLASQDGLAGAYIESGRTADAVKLLESVVAIKEKTLTEQHSSRLTSQHELARAYHNIGRIPDAIKLLESVVAIEKKTLPEQHPDRLASQQELVSAYVEVDRIPDAIKLLESVVAIEKKTLPEQHPHRLASQNELAGAYCRAGRASKAIKLHEHVVAVQEKTLKEDHLSRLTSQAALARAYADDNRFADAVKLLEHLVAVIDKTNLPPQHELRIYSEEELAYAKRCLAEQERDADSDSLSSTHSDWAEWGPCSSSDAVSSKGEERTALERSVPAVLPG